MRKVLPLLVLMMVLFCAPALAETYLFDSLRGSMDIPDDYIVLTPENLPDYASWLEAQGTSMDEKSADFQRRGVLVQAWSREMDACFELRANQNDETQLIFDVNEQSSEIRGKYRTGHYPNNLYEGYNFTASEWKNTDEGRFLVLRYSRKESGEILYKGCMRRTIRNGYEIDFDMQIYGRNVTDKDNSNLNKIWDTFHFAEVLELPPLASARINLTAVPPEETNSKDITIAGTASSGVKFTAVVMGLSYPEPIVADVEVGKEGKFSLPIRLPREGVFLITLTGEYQDEEVVELAYPVTYQSSLLAVNFTAKPGSVVTADQVEFKGSAEPGASIQVFVDGEPAFTKKVTTAGKFAFEVKVDDEGSHDISLVFSKKNLADRRFSFEFARKWTEQDTMEYLSKQSISPSYTQLQSKMKEYEGRIMAYRSYIVDIGESGDEYIIKMALNRKEGKYSNMILVTTDEIPSFDVGQRVMMYGTCEGMSLSTGTEGEQEDESYPCFALLLFATLE